MGNRIVKGVNGIFNAFLLIGLLLVIAVGGYVMWDRYQLVNTNDSAFYEVYKPDPEKVDGVLEFQKLVVKNSDVKGWITIYDTEVDYPLLQGQDNWDYINHNALGEYALTGSIFIDYENSPDFTDFNTIIYGHNMTPKVMFGSLKDFKEKQHFDEYPYGEIYFNGKKHGLEFFAMIDSDAYNSEIFNPGIKDREKQQEYLDDILGRAVHKREIGVTINDKIVLLSTCSNVETNMRDILVGRLTDEVKGFNKEKIAEEEKGITGIDTLSGVPLWIWIAAACLIALIVIAFIYNKKRKR